MKATVNTASEQHSLGARESRKISKEVGVYRQRINFFEKYSSFSLPPLQALRVDIVDEFLNTARELVRVHLNITGRVSLDVSGVRASPPSAVNVDVGVANILHTCG